MKILATRITQNDVKTIAIMFTIFLWVVKYTTFKNYNQ